MTLLIKLSILGLPLANNFTKTYLIYNIEFNTLGMVKTISNQSIKHPGSSIQCTLPCAYQI